MSWYKSRNKTGQEISFYRVRYVPPNGRYYLYRKYTTWFEISYSSRKQLCIYFGKMYTQYLGTGKSLEWVCSYSSKLLGKEVELLDGTVLTISKQRKTEVCKLFRDQAIPRRKRNT